MVSFRLTFARHLRPHAKDSQGPWILGEQGAQPGQLGLSRPASHVPSTTFSGAALRILNPIITPCDCRKGR